MRKKVKYIPTIKELVRKRRAIQSACTEVTNCNQCLYYRAELNVCISGDSIKQVELLSCCPVSNRVLAKQ